MAIKGIDAWADKLGRREMPALGGVIKELNTLTGDDDAEINQLAEVILKDANLTSQVLKIANSVQYNPSNNPINTVSRAIVLIGFTGVRAICVSVMLIESLLGKNPKKRLLEQMAKAFHAATQARKLVSKVNENEKEEVFIAGLLYQLGEMAFWSSGGDSVRELDALLDEGKLSDEDAAKKVLGCHFKAITKSLAGSWHLGETLEQALMPPSQPSPKVQAVCLGQEISQAALLGWDSPEMEEVLFKVSRFTGASYVEAKRIAEESTEEAASVALTYGAPQVCHLIPSRQRQEKAATQSAKKPTPLKADHELQLSVLRDLSNAVMEKLDVNAVLQMVLEGLHRGIGLERVVLAFVQKEEVTAKFVLGEGTESWRSNFHFPVDSSARNLFRVTIRKEEPLWLTKDLIGESSAMYCKEVEQVIGSYPCFVSGIFLGPRCIALFYADRADVGGALREEQFQSFRHFMLQTQMSLRMIAENGKK
ncbi:MAG: HDOD domain-containing protein [Cellvibrionaceae bacterium]